tara:strand:+ start:11193 stop:11522 length:330 start_codon:yes stop_codon:yes gene_type:complete
MLASPQNLKAADQWQSTRHGQEVVVDNTHDAPPEKEVPNKKKSTDTQDVLHPLDDDAYSDEDAPEDESEEEVSEDEEDDGSMLESLEDDSLDDDIPEEDELGEDAAEDE